MSVYAKYLKRPLDFILALTLILLLGWLILLCWLIAALETRSNGFYIQKRVGQFGKVFYMAKIKTLYNSGQPRLSITSLYKEQITRSGKVFRRFKLDELPQLFHVLTGTMSFVGPRPDVPGYADKLVGEQAKILQLKPGITGPASLKYRNEEALLEAATNPQQYNDQVIWPDKVQINLQYYYECSFKADLYYMIRTVI